MVHVVTLQTTLLDVLADRKTGGKIEGDIRVNVRPNLLSIVFAFSPLHLWP